MLDSLPLIDSKKGHDLDEPVLFQPEVGKYKPQIVALCRRLVGSASGGTSLWFDVATLQGLREAICKSKRLTGGQLKSLVSQSILLDLVGQGWRVEEKQKNFYLVPEAVESRELKANIRSRHLLERDAQLREPAVTEFIRSMETRRLTNKGWHSIYSVMRDGEELASSLNQFATNREAFRANFREVIDPYIQFVEQGAICSETGLLLNDIWRYFRHTWVTTYKSVPGRSMMILVRDRSRPFHPVIGIAALGSSVVQSAIRDRWIGWDRESVLARLCSTPSRATVRYLQEELRAQINNLYKKDLLSSKLISARELQTPSKACVARLRKESENLIRLHRKFPGAAVHKSQAELDLRRYWVNRSQTHLFKSKRCKRLASLLEVRRVFQETGIFSATTRLLSKHFSEARVKDAIAQLVRLTKVDKVGINMMDITVCGAIAPYNHLLGGKLVCLLLCSPSVFSHYQKRYRTQVSLIASGMQGRVVRRKADLVLLCTTSLYGSGSSQYNRLKIRADKIGGHPNTVIQYQELGNSEGFGSFQFSKETIRLIDALLGRSRRGRKVNSIFGEGVNPLMRKIREALDLLRLDSESLLRHGNKRIVYGVALAGNFREYLLGMAKRPHFILPKTFSKRCTEQLVSYWADRWLFGRIQSVDIMQQVAQHSLAYPIAHGAQVPIMRDVTALCWPRPDILCASASD
ncbi:MAG: Druantia anti-phage system protein DruA [Terriglobales bacterium]